MRRSPSIEFGAGLFIFLGIAALLFLTFELGDWRSRSIAGYEVVARFENVGRLREGASVTLAGVSIGRVTSIQIDPKRLNAVVTMRISDESSSLPVDSDAAIVSDGLLGSQYIALTPGALDLTLEANDEIELTQSAISLEHLIGKYLIDPPQR